MLRTEGNAKNVTVVPSLAPRLMILIVSFGALHRAGARNRSLIGNGALFTGRSSGYRRNAESSGRYAATPLPRHFRSSSVGRTDA
jgi:hypothetical protein